jgi:hypothetical protein
LLKAWRFETALPVFTSLEIIGTSLWRCVECVMP